jgi:hypothetical protein
MVARAIHDHEAELWHAFSGIAPGMIRIRPGRNGCVPSNIGAILAPDPKRNAVPLGHAAAA